MASWARIDVLVLDDYLLRPLTSDQAADVLEVIEDRAGLRSTILASQLPVSLWHQAMGDQTLADAALDRVCQHLHRIELTGESMRARLPTPSPCHRAGPGRRPSKQPDERPDLLIRPQSLEPATGHGHSPPAPPSPLSCMVFYTP